MSAPGTEQPRAPLTPSLFPLVHTPYSCPPACSLGGYEMHDLVVLDNTTVGVVVNVEAEALHVLTNQASRRLSCACRAASARRLRALQTRQ